MMLTIISKGQTGRWVRRDAETTLLLMFIYARTRSHTDRWRWRTDKRDDAAVSVARISIPTAKLCAHAKTIIAIPFRECAMRRRVRRCDWRIHIFELFTARCWSALVCVCFMHMLCRHTCGSVNMRTIRIAVHVRGRHSGDPQGLSSSSARVLRFADTETQ